MRLTINLSGFLEEVPEDTALPYLLKTYLRDVEKLDIHIDPKNPHDAEFKSDTALINYVYNISESDFTFELDYNPKE